MDKILILEFGGDTENLNKEIKSLNLNSEIVERDFKARDIDKDVIGVILSGGPFTVYADDIDVVDPGLFNLDIPLLGLGRGMQVMINELGGTVTPVGYKFQPALARLDFHKTDSGIFKGLDKEREVPLGFDAAVSKLPDGFIILANGEDVKSGDDRPFGAIENLDKNLYGVQYVMDVKDSEDDKKVIENFIEICR